MPVVNPIQTAQPPAGLSPKRERSRGHLYVEIMALIEQALSLIERALAMLEQAA